MAKREFDIRSADLQHLRIPDFRHELKFQKTLDSALSKIQIHDKCPWNISVNSRKGLSKIAQFLFSDSNMHIDALFNLRVTMRRLKNLDSNDENAKIKSKKVVEKIWNKLKHEHRPLLKQCCKKYDIKLLAYPTVDEARALYGLYSASMDDRQKLYETLNGTYLCFRRYWSEIAGFEKPYARIKLAIKRHKEDPTILVCKEEVMIVSEQYVSTNMNVKAIIETSYGIVVPNNRLVHIYLYSSSEKCHKHYLVHDVNSNGNSFIESMSASCVVGSQRGAWKYSEYRSEPTYLIKIDPSVPHDSEDVNPYIVEFDDLPSKAKKLFNRV